MLVVSDTTPLNYLILIDAEHVLPALYNSILALLQVIEELLHQDTPTRVRAWATRPPSWVQIRGGDISAFPRPGPGEAAALALAVQIRAQALLADDLEARSIAKSLGLIPIGTLGVLAEAHNAPMLDFDSPVASLRATSFHLRETVADEVRKRLRPRQRAEDGAG